MQDDPRASAADYRAMKLARDLALIAIEEGDHPFGAVITDSHGRVIGTGHGTGTDEDPTRHSELIAIREACLALHDGSRVRLDGCTLYSTHEPCGMCCGGIHHAHISTVVFGSFRTDLPHLFRPYNLTWEQRLADSKHPPDVVPGVLRQECANLFYGRTL